MTARSARRRVVLLGALALLILGTRPASADTITIEVFDFDFGDAQTGTPIDPVIVVGDTIRWLWVFGFHSTTSAAGLAESWDSPVTSTAGFTFEHTFTNVGMFPYYCTVHGADLGNGTVVGMSGVITVTAAVPEPESLTLLGVGTAAILGYRWRAGGRGRATGPAG